MSANQSKIPVDYGLIMLSVPLLGILLNLFWVGQMALIERPQSSLVMIYFVVIFVSSILVFNESKQVDPRNAAKNAVFCVLFWPVCFPFYLIIRKKWGLKEYYSSIVLVASYLIVLISMHNSISGKLNEFRNSISVAQESLEVFRKKAAEAKEDQSFSINVNIPNFKQYFSRFEGKANDLRQQDFLKIRYIQLEDETYKEFPELWKNGCNEGIGANCRFRSYHEYLNGNLNKEREYLHKGCKNGDLLSCNGVVILPGTTADIKKEYIQKIKNSCHEGDLFGCALFSYISKDFNIKLEYSKMACDGDPNKSWCLDYAVNLIESGNSQKALEYLDRGCDSRLPLYCFYLGITLRESDKDESNRILEESCSYGDEVSCVSLESIGEKSIQFQMDVFSKLCSNLDANACLGISKELENIDTEEGRSSANSIRYFACRLGSEEACKKGKMKMPKYFN